MWEYVHTDELYHYGVAGMKWGVRRSKAYKTARSNYRKAKRSLFKANMKRIGSGINNDVLRRSEYDTKAGKRVVTSQQNRNKAYAKAISTKATMKSMTSNKTYKFGIGKGKGYNKAEFKTYVKGMRKAGIPDSPADRLSRGKGTTLYKSITRKKGKKYADAVLKKTEIKAGNAVLLGSLAYLGYQGIKAYVENYEG